jgi:hypothetical protein
VPAVVDPVIGLSSDAVWHKPGKTPVVGGRLTTQAGIPVVGATLQVELVRVATADETPTALPDVTTGSDGTFSVPVAGAGARRVTILFAPFPGGAVTSQTVIQVRSRLALTLKPRPKKVRIGHWVRFGGRLTGAGPSAKGLPVEVQAKMSGRWGTVGTVRAKANGNWVWSYRFRFVKRNALFSFRALVRDVPGWPWPTIKSPVRKVKIVMRRR